MTDNSNSSLSSNSNSNKISKTILVFAQNKRGVLERIAMLIRKKMYNLEQITASDTEKEGIKRLTISFTFDKDVKMDQIINQINKIIEVVEVKDVSDKGVVKSESVLIKIKRPKNLAEITKILDLFKVNIMHIDSKSIILQGVGGPEETGSLIEAMKDYEILELGSSGFVAMEK